MGIRPDGSIDEINCVTGRTVHHAPPGTFPRWQMPKITRCDHEPVVHFVGFRGDEYNRAVKVWGKPVVSQFEI